MFVFVMLKCMFLVCLFNFLKLFFTALKNLKVFKVFHFFSTKDGCLRFFNIFGRFFTSMVVVHYRLHHLNDRDSWLRSDVIYSWDIGHCQSSHTSSQSTTDMFHTIAVS